MLPTTGQVFPTTGRHIFPTALRSFAKFSAKWNICPMSCVDQGTSKSSASQIRFFIPLLHPQPPSPEQMSTPANNTPQNQTCIQGVGTTSNPLPAPARTQKDGGIGNSTVGTFGVRSLPKSLPQTLTIKETGQVRVGSNAQGLRCRSPPKRWILTDVI